MQELHKSVFISFAKMNRIVAIRRVGTCLKAPKQYTSRQEEKAFSYQLREEQRKWDIRASKETGCLIKGPTRKVALLLSYSGKNYHGLQHNSENGINP